MPSGSPSPHQSTTTGTTKDPRLRVVDAAIATAVEKLARHTPPSQMKPMWDAIDVLLDMRNNVLRDMEHEPPSGGSSR
jgi:hypothetical protein